jgi:hypothetical protein
LLVRVDEGDCVFGEYCGGNQGSAAEEFGPGFLDGGGNGESPF